MAADRIFVEFVQHILDVGHNAQIGMFVFVDLGKIDIDVDDISVFGKFPGDPGDAVVEPGAESQQQVAGVQRVIGIIGAVHAGPAQGKRIVFRESAQTHQGHGDGYVPFMRKFTEFFGRPGGDDAAARVNAGGFAFGDCFPDRLDVLCADLWFHRIRDHHVFHFGINWNGFRLLDVLRDIHDDRPGTARGGQFESLEHDLRQVIDIQNEETVLDQRTGHADDIGFLKSVLADEGSADLSRDENHGDGVHVGVRDAGDQVGGAGSAGGHAAADLAGCAGVTVSRESAALFVTGQDHPEFFPFHGLMQFNSLSAGISEHHFHADLFQTACHDLCAFDGFSTGCIFHEMLPEVIWFKIMKFTEK